MWRRSPERRIAKLLKKWGRSMQDDSMLEQIVRELEAVGSELDAEAMCSALCVENLWSCYSRVMAVMTDRVEDLLRPGLMLEAARLEQLRGDYVPSLMAPRPGSRSIFPTLVKGGASWSER